MKYLLLMVVLFLAWKMFFGRRRPPRVAPSEAPVAEAMVACAYCGTYSPLGEACSDSGKYYCSQAHRSAAANEKAG